MTRASDARRKKRATARAEKSAGVLLTVRQAIPPERVNAETLTAAIEHSLESLAERGADLTGRVVITAGNDHPDYPGVHIVETKATKKVDHAECDCLVDHGEPEDDELVGPTEGGGAA